MERTNPIRKERFSILLVFAFVYINLNMFFQESLFHGYFMDALLLILYLSCLNAVSDKKWHINVSLSLLTVFLSAKVLIYAKWSDPVLEVGWILFYTSNILFYLLNSALILLYVFKGNRIDRDRIAAALCVYLMIGLCWGFAYGFLEHYHPHSFNYSSASAFAASEEEDEMDVHETTVYFSFVTLTTLGYGDISPRSDAARSLCMTEAMVGQLFLAVLIARLIGLHIAQRKED